MASRSELILMTLAAACAIAIATPAFAQTGAEYPRTGPGVSAVPGGGMGGSIGGGSLSAPRPSGSGSTSTTEIPYDGAPDSDLPPSARPAHSSSRRRTAKRHAKATVDTSAIEPAQGHLKLAKDSWAYERASTSSHQIEPVHAGKFVNVMGTSRYFAQVKLKSGEIAYVPLSAVQLLMPTDKMFLLTRDANVLTAPTHGAAKLAEVHKGHDVHAVGIALNYMKIRMKDGLEGYIPIRALQ